MTYFKELTDKLKFMSARVAFTNKEFREHPKLKELCTDYIFTSYCVANSTVPLMEETRRCLANLPKDKVNSMLDSYLAQHIEEEKGHDEWVMTDLQALGQSRETTKSIIQSPNIAALIGSQYYWVRHYHPIAFMGYIASMEVYPPTVEYVNKLIKDTGLPAEGFNTLMMHAKIDIAHREDIINLLNNLPLTDHHKKIIEMSAFQTFRYLALIMEDIYKAADE